MLPRLLPGAMASIVVVGCKSRGCAACLSCWEAWHVLHTVAWVAHNRVMQAAWQNMALAGRQESRWHAACGRRWLLYENTKICTLSVRVIQSLNHSPRLCGGSRLTWGAYSRRATLSWLTHTTVRLAGHHVLDRIKLRC